MSMRCGHLFVVPGEGTNDNKGLVFAGYTYTGHLDPNFGKGGVARISFPQGKRFRCISPRAITFDAASDAIVVGEQRIRTVDTPAGDALVVRFFTPSGRAARLAPKVCGRTTALPPPTLWSCNWTDE
jgi:hypothetical protein